MFWLKLKGGALQLTLFIIVVIALLLSGFVLLVHIHKQFRIKSDFIVETTKNADRGITYALHNHLRLNDTTTVDLKGLDYKSLKLYCDSWGIFKKVTSVSKIKNNRFIKIALIGANQPDKSRTALYIQDNNRPLVVVGNTKIEGVAYLPKQGIRSGNIAGHSYYGSQYIYGQTKIAAFRLPKLDAETTAKINTIESSTLKISNRQFLNIEQGKSYFNSFLNPVQVVFSNKAIHLDAMELTGHIIVQSKTKIVVGSFSKLKDVILIAPEIEIQSSVKGNFQAIASKKISVGKSVELNYPSALVVHNKRKSQQVSTPENAIESNIVIDANAVIKGIIIYLDKEAKKTYKTQIEIKEQATVIGELYCNKNMELKGTVYGTVYTNSFVANQNGSIYQNHIYNGTISINQLPEEYVGLVFNNSKKGVMQWLY